MTDSDSLLRLLKALFRKAERLELIVAQMASQASQGLGDPFGEAIRRLDACAAAHADHCPTLYAERLRKSD